MRDAWNDLNGDKWTAADEEFHTADGLIISLINQDLSEIEIRSFLNVGGYRIARIRAELKDPSLRERLRVLPPHVFTQEDRDRIQDFVDAQASENGFPCAHGRIKTYLLEE